MGFNSLFVRGKKFNLFSVVFSFFIIYLLIGIYNVQSLNYYHVDFYSGGGSSGIVPTLKSDDLILNDYSNNFSGYATMTGTSYSATVSFYSPHSNQIAYSTIGFSANQSCFPFGTVNANNPEMKIGIDDDADSSTVYIHSNINVNPSVSDITFIGNSDELDSSNKSYLYYQVSSNTEVGGALSQNAIDDRANLTRHNFANSWRLCDITTSSSGRSSMYAGWQSGTNRHIFDNRFFVFNSTALGSINYTFLIHSMDSGCINEGTNYYRSGYFKLENNPTFTTFGTNNNYSGVLSGLEPETLYVIQLGNGYVADWGTLTVYCDVYGSKVNSTYDFHIVIPDWDCSDYGECVNGTRFRTCIDLTEENPNKIEYQFCYFAPDETLNLGFENSTEVNVFYSYPQWWVFGCPLFINYKSVEYPSDWEINNITNPIINNNITPIATGYIADNLMMSNEDSVEGVKSLKLWYLPPQLYLPECNDRIVYENRTCPLTPYGNYTTGQFPMLYKPINESFMLSKDISFSYPNMTLTAYIKKCSSPVQEWDGDVLTWGENYSLITCGDGYYTTDKTNDWEVSTTKLFFQVYNYNTSQTLMNVRFVADLEKWKKVQIRLINMTTTDLFRFNLGVSSDSPVDSNVYCAYIDDIQLNAYSGVIPCESYCENKTYYRAIQISDYGCSYQIEEVSPLCSSVTQQLLIDSCQSFCECNSDKDDYLAYHIANNISNECVWTIDQNSDYCIEYCGTQQIKDTISDVVQDELERRGLGFLGNFFTAMFVIMMILVGIAFAVTYYLSKDKENVSWQVFIAMIIIELLVVSVLWVEFSFIGIIIAVVLALFLAKTYSSG